MDYTMQEINYITCDCCIAWKQSIINPDTMECRRFAPRVIDDVWRGVWPNTDATEGCCDGIAKDDF